MGFETLKRNNNFYENLISYLEQFIYTFKSHVLNTNEKIEILNIIRFFVIHCHSI